MEKKLLDKLIAEGWSAQFTASGTRLQEAIEEYHSLGFAVKTVPVKELIGEGCTVCFDDESDQTEMIFTKKSSAPPDDDLYDNGNG
jgi:hypothetical protein